MENLYQILGVEKGATIEEIKAAYRKKAFETHPDRPEGSKKKFLLVNEAYQILSNENKRRQYDESGKINWNSTNYEKSLDELLIYLTQEAYALILYGKSTLEIHRWLEEQGCPKPIITQIEETLRTTAIKDIKKEGWRLGLSHIVLLALSVSIVYFLGTFKALQWVSVVISIILFLTYWPRAIRYIVIGFSSVLFGTHPLSWSANTLKLISYSPLILFILFVFYLHSEEYTETTQKSGRWAIEKTNKCFEISQKTNKGLDKMKIYKQYDNLMTIYTDNKNMHLPIFESLDICEKMLNELKNRTIQATDND